MPDNPNLKGNDLYETRKRIRAWLRENPNKDHPDYEIMVEAVQVLNKALNIIYREDSKVKEILRV